VLIGAAALFLYSIPHIYHIIEVTHDRVLEYSDFVNIIGISISGIVMVGYAFWEIDERYKSLRSKMTSLSDAQNSQFRLQKRPKALTIAVIMMIFLSVEIFYILILLLLGFIVYDFRVCIYGYYWNCLLCICLRTN
jgi:hypothetical protein